jgi:hypothetical protein
LDSQASKPAASEPLAGVVGVLDQQDVHAVERPTIDSPEGARRDASILVRAARDVEKCGH